MALRRLVAAFAAALAASLLLLLLLSPTAEAGDWKGRPHRVYSEADYHLKHVPVPTLSKERMPREFSWANARGRHLLVPSWNQHEPVYCGSCFAHATLSMISDRLKIAKGGAAPDVMLSRQTFLNCAAPKGFGGGCDGGDVSDVFGYMSKFGLPDESCLTYSATDSSKFGDAKAVKSCPDAALCRNCMPVNGSDTCWAVKTPILYFLESFGRVGSKSYGAAEAEAAGEGSSPASASAAASVSAAAAAASSGCGGKASAHAHAHASASASASSSSSSSSAASSSPAAPPLPLPPKNKRGASNELAMMSELYQRGPIVCSISTPDDFVYEYRGGVYVDGAVNATRDDVDHDVEVVGWGTEETENGEDLDFWVVRNSWGTFWGELGFFRVQRGVNALFIEDGDCWYAQPEHGMETRVRRGELSGTMYGVVEADKTKKRGSAFSSSSSASVPRVDVA